MGEYTPTQIADYIQRKISAARHSGNRSTFFPGNRLDAVIEILDRADETLVITKQICSYGEGRRKGIRIEW